MNLRSSGSWIALLVLAGVAVGVVFVSKQSLLCPADDPQPLAAETLEELGPATRPWPDKISVGHRGVLGGGSEGELSYESWSGREDVRLTYRHPSRGWRVERVEEVAGGVVGFSATRDRRMIVGALDERGLTRFESWQVELSPRAGPPRMSVHRETRVGALALGNVRSFAAASSENGLLAVLDEPARLVHVDLGSGALTDLGGESRHSDLPGINRVWYAEHRHRHAAYVLGFDPEAVGVGPSCATGRSMDALMDLSWAPTESHRVVLWDEDGNGFPDASEPMSREEWARLDGWRPLHPSSFW